MRRRGSGREDGPLPGAFRTGAAGPGGRFPAAVLAFAAAALLILPARAARGGPPLEGRIYDPAAGRFLSEEALLARMAARRVVYLGERHDNPRHHRLQVRLLNALLGRGRRPAVAFEMFPRAKGAALSAYLASPSPDLSALPAIVGWGKTGWPAWSLYAPIARAALRAGLPLVATDLTRAAARAVARRGLSALPADLLRELALGAPEPGHRARVLDDLYESHCRVVPRRALGRMYDSWRARNRSMALALRDVLRRRAEGAVMITGAVHADRTLGIPRDLAALMPGVSQFSLAFVEVRPGRRRAADYAERPAAYDALWFTARHERADPCRKYRKQLERLRR